VWENAESGTAEQNLCGARGARKVRYHTSELTQVTVTQTPEPISKTRRKREAHAVQDLGEELVALTEAQLAELGLPDRLRDAVLMAKRIAKFGALRRQLQYIGRLMRDHDATEIAARIEAWKSRSRESVAYLHRLERWRQRLLESDAALTEFARLYPRSDLQRLRALTNAARKERATGAQPRALRELFQALRGIIPEAD
jgi:ribosome-associated protein